MIIIPFGNIFKSFIIVFFVFLFTSVAYAQSSSDQLKDIQSKIDETTAKIAELQEIERDLTVQIDLINNQINLTELKIQESQATINKLEQEIGVLGFRIGYITQGIERLEILVKRRIVATYQQSFISDLELILASTDFSDLILRLQYLKEVQENDKKILTNLQQTKSNYANQKDEREDKQELIQAAKQKLDESKLVLAIQKTEKDEFLAITKNDEKIFQAELRKLQADAASISQAIGNIGYKIGDVSKGEIIGSVGSSGCSTGPHLHLEVFTNAKVENNQIVGTRVDPEPYLHDGQYERPVAYDPPSASAKYGITYFLGTHTGFDIPHQFGTPIKAMESGEAYFTSAPCSYNISGGSSLGKGIVVDHQNGLVTLYWHIP